MITHPEHRIDPIEKFFPGIFSANTTSKKSL